MGANGSSPTQLTHDGNGGAIPQLVSWSPDGSKIAYVSYPNGIEQIYVMNADGSNQHNISNRSTTYESQPSWSPDGTKFAYLQGDTLAVMNADGSNPHTITNDNQDNYPSWSPDGRQITYVKGSGSLQPGLEGSQVNISNTPTTPTATTTPPGRRGHRVLVVGRQIGLGRLSGTEVELPAEKVDSAQVHSFSRSGPRSRRAVRVARSPHPRMADSHRPQAARLRRRCSGRRDRDRSK